jgi:hypothetical protein
VSGGTPGGGGFIAVLVLGQGQSMTGIPCTYHGPGALASFGRIEQVGATAGLDNGSSASPGATDPGLQPVHGGFSRSPGWAPSTRSSTLRGKPSLKSGGGPRPLLPAAPSSRSTVRLAGRPSQSEDPQPLGPGGPFRRARR